MGEQRMAAVDAASGRGGCQAVTDPALGGATDGLRFEDVGHARTAKEYGASPMDLVASGPGPE